MGDLAIQDLNTYLRQFINSSPNPTVAAVALTWAPTVFQKATLEADAGRPAEEMPRVTTSSGSSKQGYDKEAAQLAQQQGGEAN